MLRRRRLLYSVKCIRAFVPQSHPLSVHWKQCYIATAYSLAMLHCRRLLSHVLHLRVFVPQRKPWLVHRPRQHMYHAAMLLCRRLLCHVRHLQAFISQRHPLSAQRPRKHMYHAAMLLCRLALTSNTALSSSIVPCLSCATCTKLVRLLMFQRHPLSVHRPHQHMLHAAMLLRHRLLSHVRHV